MAEFICILHIKNIQMSNLAVIYKLYNINNLPI